MSKRSQEEDWVQALRTFLKDQLGNKNWQLVEKKAGKTALGIRYEDGPRSFKYIPYKWQRAIVVEFKSIKFKSFIDHPFELKKISNLTF